jgi:hypothetical protein
VHYPGRRTGGVARAEKQKLALQVHARDAPNSAALAPSSIRISHNCLNSIAALTGADAQGARRMCLLLGDSCGARSMWAF